MTVASDQYLVLANSVKTGGRCVAVVDAAGNWLRPVSGTAAGELHGSQQTNPATGKPMLPLDLVRGTFTDRKPQLHQPEDWLCPEEWESGHYVESTYLIEWIERVVDNQTEILTRGNRDRLPSSEIDDRPLESSLALVKPTSLRLYIDKTPWGPKRRAAFTVAGVVDSAGTSIEFDLGMTDPVWRTRLASTPQDEITVLDDSGDPDDAYITISVGGLHQNAYFKLVAAVITHDEVAAAAQRAAQLPAK